MIDAIFDWGAARDRLTELPARAETALAGAAPAARLQARSGKLRDSLAVVSGTESVRDFLRRQALVVGGAQPGLRGRLSDAVAGAIRS